MNEMMGKVPVKREEDTALAPKGWQPFDSLREEVDQLFENFGLDFWRTPIRGSIFDVEPFTRRRLSWGTVPLVDVAEKDHAYEITAELPGLDEKDIEVKQSDGMLTIKGEKKEETEEKKKNFYLTERRYGSFERSFRVPESVNTDKIDATFKKGVLTLVLPKKPESRSKEKKISVKSS